MADGLVELLTLYSKLYFTEWSH